MREEGHLRQDPKPPRAYVPTATASVKVDFGVDMGPERTAPDPRVVHAPLVGRIAVGVPITADEHIEEVLVLPTQLVGYGHAFALKVEPTAQVHRGRAKAGRRRLEREPGFRTPHSWH
ncbi:hypothetical protein [Streptomyces sp. NPDC040750]|uniref:LexA family protein n=1 Tax=Streptomyces sp. NPDC040750 TaxID=3154491 RepID=UPI0033ECDBCF